MLPIPTAAIVKEVFSFSEDVKEHVHLFNFFMIKVTVT